MTAEPESGLPILGWREWIRFPEFHISPLKAKIDTGARTSALHASEIAFFEREGMTWVRFNLHPSHRHPERTETAEAPLIGERLVRSSSGHVEQRPVIRAMAQLGSRVWEIELTLSARHEMGFRLLLGRAAIRGRFLVDPGQSYLLGKRPRRKSSPNAAPGNQGVV